MWSGSQDDGKNQRWEGGVWGYLRGREGGVGTDWLWFIV